MSVTAICFTSIFLGLYAVSIISIVYLVVSLVADCDRLRLQVLVFFLGMINLEGCNVNHWVALTSIIIETSIAGPSSN